MALTKMAFSPVNGLRDTVAYPAEPATEAAAREQVQGRLDELKNYINNTQTAEIDTQFTAFNTSFNTHIGEVISQTFIQDVNMATVTDGSQITISGLANIPKEINILATRYDAGEQAFSEGVWSQNGTQQCVFNSDISMVKNAYGAGFRYQGANGNGYFIGTITNIANGSFKFDVVKANITAGTLRLTITCTYH